MKSVAAFLLIGASSLPAATATAQNTTSEGGYEVTRSQTVAPVPAGYIGRKTTDRETRIGSTPETDGNSATFVMTVGGFVRECPSAEGTATGNFEYYCEAHSTPNGNDMNGIVRVQGGGGNPGALRFSAATAGVAPEGIARDTLSVTSVISCNWSRNSPWQGRSSSRRPA